MILKDELVQSKRFAGVVPDMILRDELVHGDIFEVWH